MNRLHPRVQALWILGWAISAAVVGTMGVVALPVLGSALGDLPPLAPVALAVALFFFGVVFSVLRYRLWRWEIRDDSLYLERGVVTRVRTVVPFVRIQHVDSSRGPTERALGLASTVVYTAGSRGADVTIPGLTPEGADDLRERLRRLAIRAEGEDAV